MLKKISKQLTLLLLPLIFSAVSCNKPTEPPPENYALEIIAVDASCTEVWLEIKSPEIELPQSFTLTENGEEKGSVTINKTDTAILIENLLPKQTYKYQLKNTEHKSNETEITTLVNEEKQAGKYSLEFNAIRLSSGVYFCELKTDKNYSARIKMIYLK